ncbi:hypothetical protein DYB26_015081 [Aphanomyces astaci]|nr:hypothetical protein DYB26_015081 [Aphanomyces astaci]
MQLAAHRERIKADRRQAHFEWEQRQMHQAAAQYKYAVEQDATAHTAQFKANLERVASGYKAYLDLEQQRAFNNANLNWQQYGITHKNVIKCNMDHDGPDLSLAKHHVRIEFQPAL